MKKKSLEIFMRDLVVLDIGYLEVSSVPQNIKYELICFILFYVVLYVQILSVLFAVHVNICEFYANDFTHLDWICLKSK